MQWWQHGHSSERDFIYVTTQNLSVDQLQALFEEVGPERSLLVCCSAFRGVTAANAAERWPNLTLKKIPKMVLARCEWGHDDYSLNVANLIIYFHDGKFRHIGRMKSETRVLSKWGTGWLYEHGIREVPSSYGDDIQYFVGPNQKASLKLFIQYAESRGFKFDGPTSF